MAETTRGLRALLSSPWVYRTFQAALGSTASKRRLVRDSLRPSPGCRLLDVACGPGHLLDHLASDVVYEGFDHDRGYVEEARQRFGDRGRFHHGSVSEMLRRAEELGPYDLVNASGVLHHLDDDEVRELMELARRVLAPGGRLVTLDPCFDPGQSRFARWLISRDRGRSVRTAAGYQSLAREYFSTVDGAVQHDRLRLPYTHHLMECS
jgi:SAM-dependent methyltransferase